MFSKPQGTCFNLNHKIYPPNWKIRISLTILLVLAFKFLLKYFWKVPENFFVSFDSLWLKTGLGTGSSLLYFNHCCFFSRFLSTFENHKFSKILRLKAFSLLVEDLNFWIFWFSFISKSCQFAWYHLKIYNGSLYPNQMSTQNPVRGNDFWQFSFFQTSNIQIWFWLGWQLRKKPYIKAN